MKTCCLRTLPGKSLDRFLTVALALALLPLASMRAADDERPIEDDSNVAPEAVAHAELPTLFIVGDSTVKSSSPKRGWGQELGKYFNPKRINVVNRARGGRSSKTYQTEGLWNDVLAEIKPGDFVLVQFGHNDVGRYDDPKSKWRPSLHSEGEETVEFTHPDGTKETIHSFGWYMRKYGSDAKAKGATVVFCSMVPHKDWKDDRIERDEQNTYVKWTADAAKATGAAFIDLNSMVAHRYEMLGPKNVEPLFSDQRTHTTVAGAKVNAECVVAGLRGLPGGPFDRFLSMAGRAVIPAPKYATGTP